MKNQTEISDYLIKQGQTFTGLSALSNDTFAVGQKMVEWWKEGRIFLGCGNGGSAAEISHMAGEATIRLRGDDTRPPFWFLNLAADSSILTAGANDLGYDEIFAHQVKACNWHIQKSGAKFVLIGVSTSGTSKNILRAFEEAKKVGIPTVGLTCGSSEKLLVSQSDYSIVVPSVEGINATQANQTANLAIWHIWFEMIASSWLEDSAN
jgi:D-sedoheptulose 7-phosphate isomerase